MLKWLVLGVVLAIPAMGFCQRTFTYSATDYRAITMTEPGSMSIPVTTVVIVLGDPNQPAPNLGPMRTFSMAVRPPEAKEARLMAAFVNHQLVPMNLLRSNLDGEFEATVEIPVSAGDAPDVQIAWSTKDLGAVETSVTPVLKEIPRAAAVPTVRVGKKHVI